MKIIVSPRAEKELKKIHAIDQIAVVKKIRSLQNSSTSLKKEKLAGYSDIFRIRAGHYRIVYKERKHDIYVILIGHRKDIYQLLRHFFD